jgi:3-dehydroquinate dehydratase-2
VLIGVLNGPNLNLLGEREQDQYGRSTLEDINRTLDDLAGQLGADLTKFQSNHEGELVEWVQSNAASVHGWLVNGGGYSHTSVALRDALVASQRPLVEVHMSNIFAREEFRRTSLLSDISVGVVTGFRETSYEFGLRGLVDHLRGS